MFIGGTNDDWPIDPRKDIPDGAIAIDDFEIARLQKLVAKMKEEMGTDVPMASQVDSSAFVASGVQDRDTKIGQADADSFDDDDDTVFDIQSLDDLIESTSVDTTTTTNDEDSS